MDSPERNATPPPPSHAPISPYPLNPVSESRNIDLETNTEQTPNELQSEELSSPVASILSFDVATNSSAMATNMTTEPVSSEPVSSEPGLLEPGLSEPGLSEPGLSELGLSEPGSSEPKPRKRKPKGPPPMQLPEPLTALPTSTKLPDLEDFNLRAVQLKNPLFVAICKVLIVYGNAWQSAMDLVDGIRHFNLASLGGRTPKGTIQGAISTGLALAAALRTFDPIEKQRMNSTTYYRMDTRALEPPSAETMESHATDLAAAADARRKSAPTPSSKQKKRKQVTAWDSDSMSSGSSDDEMGKLSNGNSKSSKRARTGSPSSSSSRSKTPAKQELPNGLKKLPKGYVYDTEINQSALMGLSINPSQTGEGQQQALENDFPDRRSQYGVDLSRGPSMFAVEQQTGYTYPRLRTSGRERLPKVDCEDGYAVVDLKHSDGYLGRLFCITDGHGGRACSSFVIATIPGAMQVILGKYKPSDLSLPSIQDLIKRQITEAIRLIDKEYLDYKKQQYLLFKAKKIPQDPGSDGTTLIVNIFIDKWVICINVGDSRSILGSRDSAGRWNVDFHSEDHTPSLERLAQTIYANGGEFVTHDDKVIKFDPNIKNDKKHRQSLKEARIRVKDGASNLYGIPYRTRNGQCASINLGACIGDVLYKLDPVNPVLSCKPDITFIDITTIQHGYLLMASDGLWDYVLRGGKVQDQNATVCQFVGDKIDRGWNLQRVVCTLSDREGITGLYSDSIQEYDDFTAILVTINNQHLMEGPQEEGVQQMQNEGNEPGQQTIEAQQKSDLQMQDDQPQQNEQASSSTQIPEIAQETAPEVAQENVQENAQETALGTTMSEMVQETSTSDIVRLTTMSEMTLQTTMSEVETTAPEKVEEVATAEVIKETTTITEPEEVTMSEAVQETMTITTTAEPVEEVTMSEAEAVQETSMPENVQETMMPEAKPETTVSETVQEPAMSEVVQDTPKSEETQALLALEQDPKQAHTQANGDTIEQPMERDERMEVDDDGTGDSTLSEIDIDDSALEQRASQSEDIDVDLSDAELSEDIDVDSTN
ncbi:Protein phosphatase 1L [Mortierella sp. AD094]|nr:Protein phosphatase 1L [Mortierella sp. AD094]